MLPKAIPILISSILCFSKIHAQDGPVADPAELMIWNNTDFSPLDILVDIQKRLFFQADKKIIKMGVTSTSIARIVKAIYGNNMEKFALLNDYGNMSAQIPISFAILTALWEEMTINGHMDVYKLMALKDTLHRKVINKQETTHDMRSKAISVSDRIQSAIVENAARILCAGILNGSFPYSNSLQGLANALQSFDEQISDDTIRKVIDDVYDHVTTTQLIRFVYSNQRIPQTATALVRIFYKLELEKGEDFYGAIILFLGDYLKRLTDMLEAVDISDGKKNMIVFVVSRLPTSVRSLYFASTLCIRNMGYSQYLYSPSNSDTLNLNARLNCTLGNNKSDSRAHWIAKKYHENLQDLFQFVNEYNANKFLFVSDTQPNDEGQRTAVTWIPEGRLAKKSAAWSFEVFEKYVLIVNLQYDSFLCADAGKKNSRSVFTTDRVWYVNYVSNCKWVLETCSNESRQ